MTIRFCFRPIAIARRRIFCSAFSILPALLAAACLLTGAAAFGETAEHRAGSAKAEQEIRDLTERMWSALGEQDLDAFREDTSEEWQLYTAMGSEFSAERLFEVHRENIRGFELASNNIKVRVEGKIAWATSEAAMHGQRHGEPWGGEFLMTYIYERRNGQWQCVHTHESKKNAP